MAESVSGPENVLDRPTVLPPVKVCQRARKSRDQRFDGHFFVAVLTTGVYCRSTCPARIPREDNVRYYPSAAAAQDAGFKPCRRCRPEAAQWLPEWTLASNTVMRGMRFIASGFLNDHGTTDLARELKIDSHQLTCKFSQALGTSPESLARVSRAGLAENLLVRTRTTLAQVAHHAGYSSVSRFNREIRQIFGCAPRELRQPIGTSADASSVEIKLPIRPPYNFDWVFTYLAKRALLGVEEVTGGPGSWCFRRRLASSTGTAHWLEVHLRQNQLTARIPLVDEPVHSLINRVRRVFDLNADGETLHEFLLADSYLGRWVERAPGLRVPGAWDGFETAVRAVLGQQVSVARGTELANKMIISYGDGHFPTPAQLVNREVAELGMPGRRGRAVSRLAAMSIAGELRINECQDFGDLQHQLEDIDGIGPWTANYIRMRASKDPDAFPHNDWVVLKELDCTAAKARAFARAWQPWRAYGLMYLWYAAGVRRAAAAAAKSAKN